MSSPPRFHHALLSLALATGALGAPLAAQDAARPELRPGDRISLLGGGLAERMQHHGWLEAQLQLRLAGFELSLRNLGFSADEVDIHQRTMNFGKFTADGMDMTLANQTYVPWDRYLDHVDTDVLFAFFGFNESFAGPEGVDAFRQRLTSFVEHMSAQRFNGESAPRLVLFSSIPFEDTGDPNLPNGRAINANIQLYNRAMQETAGELGIAYVDLYTPMRAHYAAALEPLTINGIHLTENGNAALADVIAQRFVSGDIRSALEPARLDAVRALVVEKNTLWFNRYRATDGYNTYGGRSRRVYKGRADGVDYDNYSVMQREMDHIDVLCENRDAEIWATARGEAYERDDSNAPPLLDVSTNLPGNGPGGRHVYMGGRDARGEMRVAPGMRIDVFADENMFPELVNPVQMAFDTRGRLWVAVWPSYPKWSPDEEFQDKLLILEDTDGDGSADKRTVFASDLHNPTGFEFWNGGVVVGQVPDIMFLKDTDGDDRADVRERLMHGLSSGDTHHSANSFVLGPDGALYFQEGTFHFSQVESPYGPVRNHNGCVWRFEPRTSRVERYIPYNFANPHGHVFDRWGQDFMTDGTGNVNYYALGFSGHVTHPDKHRGYFPFFQQRSRPCGGTEILSSSHFPEENQGSYLVCNVIGFRGIFQYRMVDNGSGFGAEELDPIVQSDDPNFRPVDAEVGPDGALYFVDWHNAIIGHLQHHIRDPNRDAEHGRVYRVTYEGRPLATPTPIHGQPIPALLENLKSSEDRVRYRTRIELSGRDSDTVVAAARSWARALDASEADYTHHRLEALWLQQQHNAIDAELLESVFSSDDHRARAAATRVARQMRHQLPNAVDYMARAANDPHPRVRLEGVVGASFFDGAPAASAALLALNHESDRFLNYAMAETMRELEPDWKDALRAGIPVAEGNEAGVEYLLSRVDSAELAQLPRLTSVLLATLSRAGVDATQRAEAARELSARLGTSVADEIVAAMARADRAGGTHVGHVQSDLAQLLSEIGGGVSAVERDELAALAEDGQQNATRQQAYALLIARDGSADQVWAGAASSARGLGALLGSVAQIEDEAVRSGLYERIRPLMYALPAELSSNAGQRAAGGTGLNVGFYEPRPQNARIETFQGLSASEELTAPTFTLNVPPAQRSDSFGLLFTGVIHIPRSGEYSFWTNSDDGSRLYIGDVQVVENDGAHAMKSVRGRIDLPAGPHPITVTYYEQGGGEGLQVHWAGPGFDKTLIPADVLGSDDGSALRAAAIRAMGAVPGRESEKLADAARLAGDAALLEATVELVRGIPAGSRPSEATLPVIDTLAAVVGGMPPEERTMPHAVAAIELGRELADGLPAEQASEARAKLEGLGGSIVLIRTLPHRMLYDVQEFWVEADKPVAILFQNNDVMPHNLVVTAEGALEEVGQAAEALDGATTTDYVPALPTVLFTSGLLNPGQTERLSFVAPTEPGDYPFVCTFPGHWRVMNGVMHVVAELDPVAHAVQRRVETEPAPVREFVANWTFDDLAEHFREGWDQNRDLARGHALFTEAGCVKCHVYAGMGVEGGPELTNVRERFTGADLVRHVLEPSLEIVEGYSTTVFELDDGSEVSGRIVGEENGKLTIVESLLDPDQTVEIEEAWITDRWDTGVSLMPTGMLVTLNPEEIRDLIAFLQSGGHGAGHAGH